LNICIYSGAIPSTTFIERLIRGLSNENIRILLVGKRYEKMKYSASVLDCTYKTSFISESYNPFLILKVLNTWFSITANQRTIINRFLKGSSFAYKLKVYAITGSLLKHKCEIFHIQWSKEIGNWVFLEDLGIKIVLSLRGAQINYSPLANDLLANQYRQIFPGLNGFHAVSKAIKLKAAEYGANLEKIQVIYSGLNLAEFNFKPSFKDNSEILRVISIGRPHWKKGYNLALDVFKILKLKGMQFEYTIVGGINDEIFYQINDLDLNREVKIISKLGFDAVKMQIQNSDLLLLPSFEEGIANVVLEAMALGTLVLSSDCGGMLEVLDDSKNGYVFQNRNKVSLENKLFEILQLEDSKALELIINARKKIENQHTESNMINGFMNFYSGI